MSISQRSDGRYVVKFKDGSKWKQKTFRAREDAEGFERSIQYDEPENTRLTVTESILLFLKSTKHARKTERAFALALDRMGDTLTGRYVDTLNRRDLEHFRDTLRTEYQATTLTINRTVRLFLAAWRWCASEDFLESVPWTKYHDVPGETHRHWCGDFDDFRRVYSLCGPALQWAVRTCLALCLRPGKELANLRWQDVNLGTGEATVWMFKTARAKIVIAPSWWLDEARARRPEDSGEYVCLNSHGRKWNGLADSWRKVRDRAGIKRVPLYTIRHMAASLMLEAGADIAAVAAQLGHKNITTTGTFYAHAVKGSQKRAAQDIPALPA